MATGQEGAPMTQALHRPTRWTSAEVAALPDDGLLREIIDGELYVSSQPHFEHQYVAGRVFSLLDDWSRRMGLGRATIAPGVLFGDFDNVAPDVAWVAADRLPGLLDEAGHLTGAPDLAVEVLSEGTDNERHDREVKRRLYDVRGVPEYWIGDWRIRQVDVLRREGGRLVVVATLGKGDTLTSPLLPGFAVAVAEFFG
jgi:Uma2 family endonuclease